MNTKNPNFIKVIYMLVIAIISAIILDIFGIVWFKDTLTNSTGLQTFPIIGK